MVQDCSTDNVRYRSSSWCQFGLSNLEARLGLLIYFSIWQELSYSGGYCRAISPSSGVVETHTIFLVPGNCLHLSTHLGKYHMLLITRKIVFNI